MAIELFVHVQTCFIHSRRSPRLSFLPGLNSALVVEILQGHDWSQKASKYSKKAEYFGIERK